MNRIVFSSVLFISFFILPWWFCAICAIAGIFLYDSYYESLALYIMIFAVYFSVNSYTNQIVYAASILFIFFLLNFSKKYIIFYQK